MPIDPVCGMEVDEDTAAAQTEYKGKTYYFCAMACKDDFEENPEIFLENFDGFDEMVWKLDDKFEQAG